MRTVIVRCPDWPVAAAGASPLEHAAVLHANRVVARTPMAAGEGVRIGHRRREAQRICPSLRLIDHDPGRDGRRFEAAVRAVAEMVPRLEVTEPGQLAFAARGPTRYFGGEAAMAERVAELVRTAITESGPTGVGFGVGVGIADGRFGAGVAAHHAADAALQRLDGRPVVRIVAAGPTATRDWLAPLPVGLLRDVGGVDAELVELLSRLGLHTLGSLATLPAADVLARFGDAGEFAHRIASGGPDRPPDAIAPPEEVCVARAFDEPVHLLEPLVFTAKQLAEELRDLLAADGLVCTRLDVLAETEHGERSEHLWHRPTGLSLAAMIERVRWQLDGWIQQPGGLSGGVALLRLTPDEVRPDNGAQLGFWGGRGEADEWAVRAVARVASLIGERSVFVPAWRGGRLPAEAYQWISVDVADVGDPGERLTASGELPWRGQLPAPSPAQVLADAWAAEVVDATGETVRVDGRGGISAAPQQISVQGRPAERIAAWAGPWPVDERWWDPQSHRRLARFQLETVNGQALLAVVERQRWWVMAVYS